MKRLFSAESLESKRLGVKRNRYRPYKKKPCRVCRQKQARAAFDHCCHTCARNLGMLAPKIKTGPHREAADPIPQYRVPAHLLQPRPPIRKVIDRQEYLVMWNGA